MSLKHIVVICGIACFGLTGCEKTEDTVMKNLSFPSEIIFYPLEDEAKFSITNSGSRSLMLRFTFNELVNWRNSTETMQVLPEGETLEIDLKLNRLLITEENQVMEITIYVPIAEQTIHIPVTIHSVLPMQTPLNYNIVDAAYDDNSDRIIAISSQPQNKLLAIYPVSGETQEILLNSRPLSMHLSNELRKVVVGQTDRFTIVDLASFTIVTESQTEKDNYAVFMPNENWLFSTPEYAYLNRINLNTGEININSYYGLMRFEQHPFRENALLGSVMKLHPSMMDVYDISNENFEKLYSSERGDDLRDVHDNFWLTRNKQLIITRGKCVFTCSPVQEKDLQFVEMLSEGKVINSMVHTDRFSQIATITRYQNVWLPGENDILFYSVPNFSVTGKIPVPVVNPQPEGPSEGFFIFTDKAQKKLYVLAADHFELFDATSWTLLNYNLEKLFTIP
jgi:hypothetical protein